MHAYRPIQPAALAFTEHGVPYSSAFDDIYHSSAGAIGQARHVFLGGNDLPQRWVGLKTFTVLETGFGLGLNFLTTWNEWRATPNRCERLHFISIEKFPFRKDDLAQLYRLWPELRPLSDQLADQWPWLTPGFHRLHLDGGRVTLTLIFGDALEWLPQVEAEVDAFYLDGFAPGKNPDLWSEKLFRQIARLSAADATCATYTVAGVVRQGLQDAGFTLEKRPGYAGKREMLRGAYTRAKNRGRRNDAVTKEKRALVIGAGIAGSSVANRLAERGWSVNVYDRRSGPGMESSGNKAGILLPVLSLDDNLQARLSRACLGYALRHLKHLARGFPWGSPGVLQIAKTPQEEIRMREIVERLQFPPEFARFIPREETSTIAGQAMSAGGWWFADGAWVHPPGLCAANLDRPEISTCFNAPIESIRYDGEAWLLLNDRGDVIQRAPLLILSNAYEARRWLPELPLSRERRQVSHIPIDKLPPLHTILCGDGYLTPAVDGLACLGASRDDTADELIPTLNAHFDNLKKLKGLLPEASPELNAETLEGRVAYRPGSPDRLPMAGPIPEFDRPADSPICQLHQLPRRPGLFGALGFGARGLTWSALCAEIMASRLNGEPLPVECGLADAIDPGRFWLRELRKR